MDALPNSAMNFARSLVGRSLYQVTLLSPVEVDNRARPAAGEVAGTSGQPNRRVRVPPAIRKVKVLEVKMASAGRPSFTVFAPDALTGHRDGVFLEDLCLSLEDAIKTAKARTTTRAAHASRMLEAAEKTYADACATERQVGIQAKLLRACADGESNG